MAHGVFRAGSDHRVAAIALTKYLPVRDDVWKVLPKQEAFRGCDFGLTDRGHGPRGLHARGTQHHMVSLWYL